MIKNLVIAALVGAAVYFGSPHAGAVLAMFRGLLVGGGTSLGYGY